jgi:hypothetical protein
MKSRENWSQTTGLLIKKEEQPQQFSTPTSKIHSSNINQVLLTIHIMIVTLKGMLSMKMILNKSLNL